MPNFQGLLSLRCLQSFKKEDQKAQNLPSGTNCCKTPHLLNTGEKSSFLTVEGIF